MELNTIMQALVKDLAEQLRPMVGEMVKQEIANNEFTVLAGGTVLENIAATIDLSKLAELLTPSQLSDLAENIDLSDLAGEFDANTIMQSFDLDGALRDFFQNNTFSIRP